MEKKKTRNKSRKSSRKNRSSILGFQVTDHCLKQMQLRGIDEMLVSLCLAKGKPKRIRQRQIGVLALSLGIPQLNEAIHSGYACPKSLASAIEFVVVTKGRLVITAYLRWGDWGICLNKKIN